MAKCGSWPSACCVLAGDGAWGSDAWYRWGKMGWYDAGRYDGRCLTSNTRPKVPVPSVSTISQSCKHARPLARTLGLYRPSAGLVRRPKRFHAAFGDDAEDASGVSTTLSMASHDDAVSHREGGVDMSEAGGDNGAAWPVGTGTKSKRVSADAWVENCADKARRVRLRTVGRDDAQASFRSDRATRAPRSPWRSPV